jgi:hypothetical protein
MVFNKPVKASTFPTTATLTLQRLDGGNSGTTFWGISGLTVLPDGKLGSGNTTAAKGCFGNGGRTATWDGTVALSVDRKTITFHGHRRVHGSRLFELELVAERRCVGNDAFAVADRRRRQLGPDERVPVASSRTHRKRCSDSLAMTRPGRSAGPRRVALPCDERPADR